jgi:SHS2 domain-containing protein
MAAVFELLEHPSDIGILGRGASREETLVAVSHGLTEVMVDVDGFRPSTERVFRIGGQDAEAQIINWLNEILFFFDTEALVFTEFAIDSWSAQELLGRAWGETVDLNRHELRTSVKAATYHQFDFRQTEHGWELRVFIDI